MRVAVQIGGARSFRLRHAVMVYDEPGGRQAYVTVHPVIRSDDGPARLGAGRAVDRRFVRQLADEVGTRVPAEVLPACVLCRTADGVTWWTRAGARPMFFREGSKLEGVSGRHFPHPALVWKVDGAALYVRALAADRRPDAETALKVAPYWNVGDAGLVCQGDMRRPDMLSVGELDVWEEAFFGSLFTHANARRLIGGKGGAVSLWRSLAAGRGTRKRFPADRLLDAKETLLAFVEGGDRARA